MSKVLVVAAHPDDEIIGVGAAVARHVSQGDEARCIILGEGQASRFDNRETVDKEILYRLHNDTLDAAKIIGYSKVNFADFPDNRFDSADLLDIVKYIEKVKKDFKPDIIYTHHGGDLNIDHQLTYKAVLTAARPIKGSHEVKEIYAFETLSSTEWDFSYKMPFTPNVFVDVTETFENKLQAMKCYKSELCTAPHPRSLEIMEASAKKWGSIIGRQYSEAFMLVRSVI